LTGTLGGVAFNLGVSLVFALTAIGAYGVLYNMLSDWQRREKGTKGPVSSFVALTGPLFVLIVSNLSGMLQLMRANGIFWHKTIDGEWVSAFWAWLDIGSFSAPPTETDFNYWWWWQGSRIIQDYDYLWNKKEGVIDEFPFFSFLLADLHPHLIALPFGLLAMAVALNLMVTDRLGRVRWLCIRLDHDLLSYGFAAFVLGALGFLNTWDFPFYVALFAGVYAIKCLHDNNYEDARFSFSLIKFVKDFITMGILVGIAGGLAYLPFYLGLSSQASGLNPNLIYVTKGIYEWIIFAPLLIPIFGLLIYLWKKYGDRLRLVTGFKVSLVLLSALLLVMIVLTALLARGALIEGENGQIYAITKAYLDSLQAPGLKEAISEGIARRISTPGTLLTILPIIITVTALLWPRHPDRSATTVLQAFSKAHTFALLLTLMGAVLVLIPEFFYLRDFFGYRINTIFKLYFMAWVLWSVAAAYGLIVVWKNVKGISGAIFKTISISVLVLALLYPIMSIWSRTNAFNPRQWELDGTAHLKRRNQDEAAAINWLQEAPVGIVAESIGRSYSKHARFSTHSGHPTVLGWIGHERQWRGGFEEMGSREDDIARLFCSRDWQETHTILKRYGIRYIVVGSLERTTYKPGTRSCKTGLNEKKFIKHLTPVFQQGKITIYETL
jgi:YYY domain-containing protein